MSKKDLLISGFSGSKSEKEYLMRQLMPFQIDGWIERVLFTVKRGKEAAVYCCKANPASGHHLLAAKVYHPRGQRSMQNYAAYLEGRGMFSVDGGTFLKARERKALQKGTDFGRAIGDYSWTTHEYATLSRLEEIGVKSPLVYDMSSSVILMEYFGDEYRGAPTLIGVDLDRELAPQLFDDVMHALELMLEDFLIHGDLSAYNLLFWENEVIIIDVPQVVDPMSNPNAHQIFRRDVIRVCEYFNRYGIEANGEALSERLWRRYVGDSAPHGFIFGNPVEDQLEDQQDWEEA